MAKKSASEKSAGEAPKEEKIPPKRGTAISKITVDYWKTKAHLAQMGIKKDLEYQSRSRQFAKGYEIKGEVVFNDDTKGDKITKQIIAMNMNDWDQKDLTRRLIIRTFTELVGESGGRFIGGIECSILESLQLSMSGDKPLSVLILVIPDSDYLIRIFRMRRIKGDSFVFVLPPGEKDKNFHFIEIAGKMGAGDDFNIKEGDEIIGDIDDKVLDFGGKYVISIKNLDYQYSKVLLQALILFCCALKWLKDLEKDIDKLYDMIQHKEKIPQINFNPFMEELDLFKNPRKFKS